MFALDGASGRTGWHRLQPAHIETMSTYQETLICRLQLSRSVAEAEEGLIDDLSDKLEETQKRRSYLDNTQ